MENLKDSEERLTMTTKGRDPPSPVQDRPKEEEAQKAVKNVQEEGGEEEVEAKSKTEAASGPEPEEANIVVQDEAKDVDDDYYNSTSSALSEDRWEEMHQRLIDFKVCLILIASCHHIEERLCSFTIHLLSVLCVSQEIHGHCLGKFAPYSMTTATDRGF